MPIHDLRYRDTSERLHADVCIIGSGPAGWTLSEELSNTGLSIIVLESGDTHDFGLSVSDVEADALNETEDVGVPLFNGRRRALGGTPEIIPWGNRCIAFEPIDYEPRSWVAHSGWPVKASDLDPYLDKASRHLGAGPYFLPESASPPAPRGVNRPDVSPKLLKNIRWNFGRGMRRDTIRYASKFRKSKNIGIKILVNATVVHINTNEQGNRVISVDVSTPEGVRSTVHASTVVLCAGGIENARTLLLSSKQKSCGLGNDYDLVGRFLMDHPRDLNMAVTVSNAHADSIYKHFGPYLYNNGNGPREFVEGLGLGPELQRNKGLLNCAAWPVIEVANGDPFEAAQRLLGRNSQSLAGDLVSIVSDPLLFAKGVYSWGFLKQPIRTRIRKIGFFIGSEQCPNPNSRIMLSEKKDKLGNPISLTDWRVGDLDRLSQATLAKTMQQEFRRLHLPELKLANWVCDDSNVVMSDGCHPTGTTRMAFDKYNGVVDQNCQVYGVSGLFVSGSSIFPTAGHANPTLMIVAFAVRLADHLKKVTCPLSRIAVRVDSDQYAL